MLCFAEEEVILSDGAVECSLERSLLYCLAHPIAAGDESPLHARLLFRRAPFFGKRGTVASGP